MEFQIGEKFFVRSDEYNWVLEEKKVVPAEKSKTGELSERMVIAGYYTKLDQLANAVIERGLKDSECKSLQEVKEWLESASKSLRIEIKEKVKDK